MYTKAIIDGARNKIDDWTGYGKGKELWPDAELLPYLNNAQNDWARQTRCFRDYSTEAICKVLLLANQHTYTMDSRIVAVHEGRLESGWPYIDVKDEIWLSDYVYSWQTLTGDPRYILPDAEVGKLRVIPYFDTDGYFTGTMEGVAGTKTFTLAGQNFSTYLEDGDEVDIRGILNSGVFTVASATADSFTVDETIQTETVATVVREVMDTLWLSVDRLPLNQLTLAAWETQSPEINFDYHTKLIDGILREAYEKNDSETYDPQAATKHRGLFQLHVAMAKKEKLRLRHSTRVLRPHPGTI